jgi:hypothetical protein
LRLGAVNDTHTDFSKPIFGIVDETSKSFRFKRHSSAGRKAGRGAHFFKAKESCLGLDI